MGHPEDSMMHEEPERFDVDAQHNQHVHPVIRDVLADALQAAAPAYGRDKHQSVARAIEADVRGISVVPLSDTPPEQDATGGKDAPSFDAEKFIKAEFTPIQIGYMLTGDWDCVAAAIRAAYYRGRVEGGRAMARAAGVNL